MAEIHKCGQGWAYCDGNCTTCAVNNCYTTNGTITLVKDYPPYLDHPKERKKQTNADKIRQMSDEALADFIGGIFTIERDMWGDYDPRTVVTQEPRVEARNKEDMLDWLKQEVESDG